MESSILPREQKQISEPTNFLWSLVSQSELRAEWCRAGLVVWREAAGAGQAARRPAEGVGSMSSLLKGSDSRPPKHTLLLQEGWGTLSWPGVWATPLAIWVPSTWASLWPGRRTCLGLSALALSC